MTSEVRGKSRFSIPTADSMSRYSSPQGASDSEGIYRDIFMGVSLTGWSLAPRLP